MNIKIKVTQKDILAGRPKNCSKCPIALAVQRKLCQLWNCAANRFVISVGPNIELFTHKPVDRQGIDYVQFIQEESYKVMCFISDFDNAIKVKPFEFTLRIPKKTFEEFRISVKKGKRDEN